jgi:diguanylate cyclase (GGDEF)-like protein
MSTSELIVDAATNSSDNEKQIRERVRLLESVVQNYPGGLLLFDRSLRLVFCNERQKLLLDYPSWFFGPNPPTIEEIFRYNATRGEYGPGDPEAHVDLRMKLVARREEHVFERRRPNGTLLEIRGVPLEGGGFVTTYLDVTEQRRGRDALQYLATHDILTNLPNRVGLYQEIERRAETLKEGMSLAVIFLDLDGFKPVNDRFGHALGDEVLKIVGRRLRNSIREADYVARFGGDEFVILANFSSTRGEIEQMAQRVARSLRLPVQFPEASVEIGVSIGIAIAPDEGTSAETLLEVADSNMYFSKRMQLGCVFSDSLGDRRLPAIAN